MNAAAVINIAVLTFLVTAVVVLVRLCRTRPYMPVRREVGPDRLCVLHDLDAHLDEYVAEDPDLWNAFGSDNNTTAEEDQT